MNKGKILIRKATIYIGLYSIGNEVSNMFYLGLLLIIIGAFMVYGTPILSRIMNISTARGLLIIKVGGLLITILGAILIFIAQFPERLQFLRIVKI